MSFSTGSTWSYRGTASTRAMNQYSGESNGPGPYMGNNHMPPMNYNQSNSMDMAQYHQGGGCMNYNNQGTYNNMNSQYMPPGQYPPNTYGNSYPNHMYGPMNHHTDGAMSMPGPGPGPYPNSCPPSAMQGPPTQPMGDNMYPASGNEPSMLPPYPNGQPQTMGYFSSMINSPLPSSPHQIQGSSPAPTPTPTPPVRPTGQFAYPGASPLHPQSRTSPISPMMVKSPASVHSNHSVPSSSPGPISSPVQGVKSPLSVNASGMMSPNSNQSLRSPNQPMRSPHSNHPLNSPNHMNQSMTPSPQTHAMMSPNHQGHFSPPASVPPGGMSSSSNTSHSNGPLQSLQKLVMLPEKRVVDPKTVVGDNGVDGGVRCVDGRHCSTDSEMNTIDMCGRNELAEAECRPLNIPTSIGQDIIHDKNIKIDQYSPGRFSNRCSESSGSPRRLSEDGYMKSPQRLVSRRKSDRMSTGSHPDSRNSVDGESDKESVGRSRKDSGRSLGEENVISNSVPLQIKSDCPDGPLESSAVQRTNSDSEEVIVDSPMVKVEIDDPNTPIPGGSGDTPKKKRGRPFGSKTKNKKEKPVEKDKGKNKGGKKKLALPERVEKKPFVGPTLKIDGPKDRPTTCTIVNHRQTEYEKVDKNKKHPRHDKKERTVTQAVVPDRPLTNAPWVCCFCGRGSTYQRLGDLFGPYFIEGFKPPVVKSEPRMTSPKISGSTRPKKRKAWDDDDSDMYLYDYPTCPKQKKKRSSPDGKGSKEPDKKGAGTSPGAKDTKTDCGEAWVHEECAVWAQGVYMVGNKLQGLPDAAKIAIQTTCSGCKNNGATIGCLQKGCNQKYHYLCAVDKDCLMYEENFSLFCPKHKNKKIKMIGSFEKGT